MDQHYVAPQQDMEEQYHQEYHQDYQAPYLADSSGSDDEMEEH